MAVEPLMKMGHQLTVSFPLPLHLSTLEVALVSKHRDVASAGSKRAPVHALGELACPRFPNVWSVRPG